MPEKSPLITAWAPFRSAERLSGQSEQFVTEHALQTLSDLLGPAVRELQGLLEHSYLHDWQSDPFSLGAYSYGKVGADGAQQALANPLENTVFFFKMRCPTLRTFVQHRAQKREREAEKEKKRRDDVRQDSNVRILYGSEEIDREEKNKSEQRRGGQHHAGPTEPVLEMTPKRSRRWTCSLRHRGKYLAAC